MIGLVVPSTSEKSVDDVPLRPPVLVPVEDVPEFSVVDGGVVDVLDGGVGEVEPKLGKPGWETVDVVVFGVVPVVVCAQETVENTITNING